VHSSSIHPAFPDKGDDEMRWMSMAVIVFQTSKQTGITYAYESVSYWDKEKQQSRPKRKCIGRLDPVTNEIIPTRKRGVSEVEPKEEPAKRGPIQLLKQLVAFTVHLSFRRNMRKTWARV